MPVGNAVATHPPPQSLSTVSPQYGRLQHFHCRTAALPHDHAVDNMVTPCDIKEHQSNPQLGRKEASVGGGALCKVFLDGDNAGACVSFKGIGWLTSLSNHSSHMTLLGPSRLQSSQGRLSYTLGWGSTWWPQHALTMPGAPPPLGSLGASLL